MKIQTNSDGKCNVSFALDYSSPENFTDFTLNYKYRIKGSDNPYEIVNVVQLPNSGEFIRIENIQSSGEYEIVVTLIIDGVRSDYESDFEVIDCDLPICETPKIMSIDVEEDGQIIIKHEDDKNQLADIEYQIAKDSSFEEIIHMKIGLENTRSEEVNMNYIPNETRLFFRARKHCFPFNASNWSNNLRFITKVWSPKQNL